MPVACHAERVQFGLDALPAHEGVAQVVSDKAVAVFAVVRGVGCTSRRWARDGGTN